MVELRQAKVCPSGLAMGATQERLHIAREMRFICLIFSLKEAVESCTELFQSGVEIMCLVRSIGTFRHSKPPATEIRLRLVVHDDFQGPVCGDLQHCRRSSLAASLAIRDPVRTCSHLSMKAQAVTSDKDLLRLRYIN
jgi:hypothetical protein